MCHNWACKEASEPDIPSLCRDLESFTCAENRTTYIGSPSISSTNIFMLQDKEDLNSHA